MDWVQSIRVKSSVHQENSKEVMTLPVCLSIESLGFEQDKTLLKFVETSRKKINLNREEGLILAPSEGKKSAVRAV